MSKFETFQKYSTICLITTLCGTLFLAHVNKQVKPPETVEVTEWIDSNYTAFIDRHPQRANIIAAIKLYTRSDKYAEKYTNLILEHSFREGLDPILVTQVIAKESSFRRNAHSFVGARGLMQVMPNWRMDLNGVMKWTRSKNNPVNLYDPAINIMYGTKILKHYLTKYEDEYVALAAYNGSKGSTRYADAVYKTIAFN